MNSQKSVVFQKINYFLLAFTVSAFYFCRYIFMPLAIVFLLLAVVENNWRERYHLLKQRGWLGFAAVMLAFYLLYMVGTLYSSDVGLAFSEWEYKIWLLVAPVALLPILARTTRRQNDLLLLCFVISVLVVAVLCMLHSVIEYVRTDNVFSFFYMNAGRLPLNSFSHPSYCAMYETVCMVIVIEFLRGKNELLEGRWRRRLSWLALGVFLLHIFLLQSKMAVLVFAALFLFYLIFLLNLHQRRVWATLGILLVLVVGGVMLVSRMNTRVVNSLQTYQEADKVDPQESSAIRMALWQCSWEIYEKNWAFGVGPGDVLSELHDREVAHGYVYLSQHSAKCHNQYLQNMVALGIPGLLVLLAFWAWPAVFAWRKKDLLTLLLIFIVGANMLVDCVLQYYPGSTFTPIFLSICFARGHSMPCGEKWA
ncbi:MAG: O-antigen ligase family protein [Bacteroidales bacterium]|nr:O-antigen ligase family protein [Bacteroidales bacterium]